MSKSYRIRTTPGIDKNIRIDIQQDFDLIEILSLKLKQEDVYTRFCAGNWDADRVRYYTPYLNDDKAGILKDGEKCCETLGIDFDEVYRRTNTSYKPMIDSFIDIANYGIIAMLVMKGKWKK